MLLKELHLGNYLCHLYTANPNSFYCKARRKQILELKRSWVLNKRKIEILNSGTYSLSSFTMPFFFLFNRRIIALQCCVGFCHTTAWISCKYTYVPSLLNLPSPPHLTLLEHQVELPVSYSNFPLALCLPYGNVYVSVLPSHSSHPLLPPLCPQVCSQCLIDKAFLSPLNEIRESLFFQLLYSHEFRVYKKIPSCFPEA